MKGGVLLTLCYGCVKMGPEGARSDPSISTPGTKPHFNSVKGQIRPLHFHSRHENNLLPGPAAPRLVNCFIKASGHL